GGDSFCLDRKEKPDSVRCTLTGPADDYSTAASGSTPTDGSDNIDSTKSSKSTPRETTKTLATSSDLNSAAGAAFSQQRMTTPSAIQKLPPPLPPTPAPHAVATALVRS